MTDTCISATLPTTDPDITADPDPPPLWVLDIGCVALGNLLRAVGCNATRKASICYSAGTRLETAYRAGLTWAQMTPTERAAVTTIYERYR